MRESESSVYFNRIIKTSAFVLILVMLSKVLGYAYKIIIARHFNAEVYGLFSLSMIVISIAVSLASVGLFEGLVRQISIYRGQKDEKAIKYLAHASKNFFIISGFILFGITFLSAPWISINIFHEPRLIVFLRIMALAIPFVLITNMFLSILRAYEKIKTQSIITNIIQNSSKFFILLLFIFIGLNTVSVPLSYLFACLVMAIVSWFYARKILNKIRNTKEEARPYRELLTNVMSYSWPLMFVGVLTSIFYWTDSLIIGYYMGVGNVGIYNVAITLVAFLGIVPELFIQLLFPVAARNLSNNKDNLVNPLIKRVAKWILFINSLIAIICFFFAPQIISLLFGNEFASASSLLRILAVGALFTTLASYFTNLLTVVGKTKTILGNLIMVATINAVLDLIAIPVWGMVGAAIATSVSGFILFLITLYQIKKFYSVSPINEKALLVLFEALIIFLIAFLFLKDYSFIIGSIVVLSIIIIYIFSLIMIRFFDYEDYSLFNKIIRKILFIHSKSI